MRSVEPSSTTSTSSSGSAADSSSSVGPIASSSFQAGIITRHRRDGAARGERGAGSGDGGMRPRYRRTVCIPGSLPETLATEPAAPGAIHMPTPSVGYS
ncbi:hypothetical protein GCM10027268_12940 [Brachybacterium huguangmaarense]